MTKRPHVWAVVSDLHVNSTVGLCPASGVRLDDGGTYMPSNSQVWLWERWLETWSIVVEKAEEVGGWEAQASRRGIIAPGPTAEGVR